MLEMYLLNMPKLSWNVPEGVSWIMGLLPTHVAGGGERCATQCSLRRTGCQVVLPGQDSGTAIIVASWTFVPMQMCWFYFRRRILCGVYNSSFPLLQIGSVSDCLKVLKCCNNRSTKVLDCLLTFSHASIYLFKYLLNVHIICQVWH